MTRTTTTAGMNTAKMTSMLRPTIRLPRRPMEAGGFNIGFWSASASFNHAESQSSLDIQTKDLEITFKYCAVDVKRPWLDTSLLNLKNWFLMGNYKKNCISTGAFAQQLPDPKMEPTFLPSLVTSMILIKDLRIHWGTIKEDWAAQQETNSASVSVGFGPFAVNGSYSHHSEKRDFTADIDGESLSVPGIQLVGYVSTINPAAPGVDSADFLAKPAVA